MITSKHINAQGMVPLWEATDDGHRQVMMAPVDATHALSVEPKRWSLDKPERSESEFGGDSAGDQQSEPEHTGATGPAWYPPSDERSESEKGSG